MQYDWYHESNTLVAPMSMNNEKPLQESKLCDGEITGHDCLYFGRDNTVQKYIRSPNKLLET